MLTLILALVQAPMAAVDTIPMQWTPHRVYDSHRKEFTDFEAMAGELAKADVVFFGEQHDDVGTHRMQRALLEAIGRRRSNVVLAMEMFERDVQPVLDQYLAGTITEEQFLAASRPWPKYARDYRPLVEYARARGWKVVAGNVPRRLASAVAKEGMPAVVSLPDSTRRFAAAEFRCPVNDDYFERCEKQMGGHAAAGMDARTTTLRYYEAQCVKDETMAESIAAVMNGGPDQPLVVHVNGSFHSDFGDGTAERLKRRRRDAKVEVVTGVPVTDLDAIKPKPDRKKGDWLVYTLGTPAK